MQSQVWQSSSGRSSGRSPTQEPAPLSAGARSPRWPHRSSSSAFARRSWSTARASSWSATPACWPPSSSASSRCRCTSPPTSPPPRPRAYRIADNRTNRRPPGTRSCSPSRSPSSPRLTTTSTCWALRRRARRAARPAHRSAWSIPTRCPSCPRSRSPGPVTSGSWATIACSAATATNVDDVERLMDGKRATLMATDPPYLVNYDGGNHPPTWANGGKKPGAPSRQRHPALGQLRRPRDVGGLLRGVPAAPPSRARSPSSAGHLHVLWHDARAARL